MLQQTQVERVIPYYKAWIKKFPNTRTLSDATLSQVLALWQGLGYNRRAKFLYEAAKKIEQDGWGDNLPGVGEYTKAAISVFAFNKPVVMIETNIRTVFIHFYSSVLQKTAIDDAQIRPLIEEALKKSKMEPRDFYAALMDYGSYLKKTGVRVNSKSKHYTKQTKFEGSSRQKRAALLRTLLKNSASERKLLAALK